MRARTSAILAALGIVVLALGLYYGGGPAEQTQQVATGQLLFPGLTPKLAEAAQVEIVHKGATLHLRRTGTTADAVWGVADRSDYPAQQGKVHEVLTALTDLRLDDARTSDPADYARLGVEDADGKGADSTLLRVLDAKGGVIAALIVGHARSAAHGGIDTLYVRRPGEAQSWLADGRIAVTADAQDWLDRDIVNIDAAKIATDTVTRGDATLQFARKDGKLVLTAPADHPKLDDFKLEEVGRALSELNFDNVQKAPAPGTPLGRAVVTTTDGMTVTVDVSKSGPDIWATFAATGKDAAALDARTKGWAYQLGAWKEQTLVPSLDDLKLPEPKPAPAAAAPAPAPAPAPAAPPAQ